MGSEPTFTRLEVGMLLNALSVYTLMWRQGATDDRVPAAVVEINMGMLDRTHDIVRKLGGNPDRPDFGAGDYLGDPPAG